MAAKALLRYFVRGCLVSAPLALTAYIVYVILRTVDSVLPVPIPGVGLLITVALLTLIGSDPERSPRVAGPPPLAGPETRGAPPAT